MASKPTPSGKREPGGTGSAGARKRELTQLGRYTIKRKLGAGGMGTVFLAEDTQLKRTVALKVLPKERSQNPTLVKRFKAEAQSAARLKHDNIVAVYDAGQADGFLYIALEYIDGIDVHDLASKRGRVPVKRSIDIIKQVARALQHAHEQGIVHRDIKPANLMIQRDGTVKLADMGLARSVDETMESGITRAGTTVGTVDYMSPEQARSSKAADTRSDIYSLGCTWYHMLVGGPPFPADSLTNKLNAHATQPPPDPRTTNEGVPETIVAVIHRMMAKKAEDRYQTPAELLEDLENTNLSRSSLSNDVLAALAEESGQDMRPDRPRPQSGIPAALPPKDRPAQSTQEDTGGGGFNLQSLKSVAAIALALAALLFLGWIISKFGSALDNKPSSGRGNPFARAGDQAGPSPSPATSSDRDKSDKAEGGTESPAAERSSADKTGGNDDEPAMDEATQDLLARSREGEREHLPEWLTRGSATSSARDFSSATVGERSGDGPHFDSLDEAIRAFAETGGTVRLTGSGPFFLRSVQLDLQERLVVKAANRQRPLVVLVPSQSEFANVLVDLVGGTFELAGVDVVLFADLCQTSDRLVLIGMESGDLTLRDCSVTLRGSRPGETTALLATGLLERADRKDGRSHILLDRVVVRGDGLGAIKIDQPATDLVANNCLFATGRAPVVSVADDSGPPRSASSPSPSGRELRFVSTTARSKQPAFSFWPGSNSLHPPRTSVVVINSLFAAGQQPSVLLSLHDWPLDRIGDAGSNGFESLKWTSESSLYLGWEELIHSEAELAGSVRDAGAWQRVWGTTAVEAQFQRTVWPESPPQDLGAVLPTDLDSKTLDDSKLRATDGGAPGCEIEFIHVPNEMAVGRASDRAAIEANSSMSAQEPGTSETESAASETEDTAPKQTSRTETKKPKPKSRSVRDKKGF